MPALRVRAKSVALTAHAVAAAESELSALGFELATPREAEGGVGMSLSAILMRRIAAPCSSMRRWCPDREPDILRLGMPPPRRRSRT
jgi:kynureninase